MIGRILAGVGAVAVVGAAVVVHRRRKPVAVAPVLSPKEAVEAAWAAEDAARVAAA